MLVMPTRLPSIRPKTKLIYGEEDDINIQSLKSDPQQTEGNCAMNIKRVISESN